MFERCVRESRHLYPAESDERTCYFARWQNEIKMKRDVCLRAHLIIREWMRGTRGEGKSAALHLSLLARELCPSVFMVNKRVVTPIV